MAEDIDKERFRATCLIGYCGLTWTGKQSRSPISWVFNMLGLPGGFARNLTFGVGWGGVGMIPFLAIAHISVLRN